MQNVTHVICSMTDSSHDPIRDQGLEELVRLVNDEKIFVGSAWLKDCHRDNARLDEGPYIVTVTDCGEKSSRTSSIGSRKRKANDELHYSTHENETRPGVVQKLSNEKEEVGWNFNDKAIAEEQQQTSMEEEETQLDGSVEVEQEPARVVMFSGFKTDVTAEYGKSVEALGGTVWTGKEFSRAVTHLVCDQPGKHAKYLSAIAAGKWVLHQSFLEQSVLAGRWEEETAFEWGGPRNAEFVAQKRIKKEDLLLADAARRLRNCGGGAFREWRVCLVDEPDKVHKLSGIITAGGGVVVPSNPLPSVGEVTHLLLNKKQFSRLPDLSAYVCLTIDFLPYFLAARTDAESKKFIKKFSISAK